ncbi:basal body-orientation factor 1 isoform X2 [Dromiciops gliroides]|uniref:basal body-orientation factor 1 isoform X2 n=1 Tax=Dromiciops gliroides TaxID=33562 RepID=UPI001CC6FB8D|nr:basal body-orientation factor 1 isoform X2 [Dromiciops gliroides]
MAKGRGKQRGRGKKGKDKKDKRLSKRDETELERARANAALWEARLEVSEISRDGYREAVRRLAQCNEDLKRQQYKMEKDTMAVLSYIKRQDTEKDLLIEKLRQQLLEAKDKSEVDKEILQERYALKINELEGQYNQKTKEIGLIQIELKTIKQFQRRKTQIERELEELRDTLRNSEKKHQDTLRRLEGRFFEEKCRLEKEAEKKVVMLAERAHQEAVVQLNNAGRAVFKENVHLQKALAFHVKEANELQVNSKKLQEDQTLLLQQKETNELLVREKIMQITQHRAQIQCLQKKVEKLETALGYMTAEFEAEIKRIQEQAFIANQAGRVEINKLEQVLQMKDREMNRVKKLAKNILDERTEVERFFLDALYQVKQQISVSRKDYKKMAQAAFNLKMREAYAGKTEYPRIRTFDGRVHSTNSVNQDLREAEKWTNIKKGMDVDIGDLTWEQKEKVLRLLFAKMNGCPPRKHNKSSIPPVPNYVTLTTGNKDTLGDDCNVQDQTFITQQVPLTESSGLVLPNIQKGPDHSVS